MARNSVLPLHFDRDGLMVRARSCGVRVGSDPRGLIDPKGAVPGLARGLGHTAPTYAVGFPGSISHGLGGFARWP